jgi:ribosomal-protein-alanine N-acetyltransferase
MAVRSRETRPRSSSTTTSPSKPPGDGPSGGSPTPTALLVGRAGFGGDATDRQLSFTIRRSHWGLGLATEIAGALVGWHVSHAGAASLRAIAAVGNHASVRVLEKVGFHEVGTEDFDGTLCHSFVHRSW